ncbi:MAG: DegT/DnrJ/EryC1/StrS family aminotransferase [Armatimonadota bacterium]|nr:MAG: DegT/DnrJ/EryC1/StrS family aminotransferase [Armatimonadota bacterium]
MTTLKSPELAINGGTPVRTKPFPTWPVWDDGDAQAVADALRSGKWGIGGGAVEEFEKEFAEFQQAKYCSCLVNGTAAIEVALRAVGVEAGDEIIVPPYTFIATASACLMVNTVPVFVDIEPDTYNLDPTKIEAAITDRTRAVIAVHIAGCPADMDGIMAIAKKHNLKVIEDCAQAHAAEWRGRRVGAIGDLGTFSFQSSKNLNSGEGGACVTDNEEIFHRCWSLQNVGRARSGQWYEHPVLGWNYRMTQFQGALLRSQLQRVPAQTERRTANAAHLTERLNQIDGISPMRVDERVTRHAYHLYMFRYDASAFNGLPREDFIKALNAEGITCSSGYVPLYKELAFRNCDVYSAAFKLASREVDYDKVSCPVCEKACADEAVWLYQAWLIGEDHGDVDDIANAIEKIHAAAAAK